MLFLNLLFMAGLTAAAAPIILHLLNRRSAKTLDWGATRFLHEALTSRRRRVFMEQILLLVLRCLLIALVVLAMARPLADAQSRVPWLLIVILMLLGIACLAAACACWDLRRWRHALMSLAVLMLLLACASTYLDRIFTFRRFGGGAPKDVVIMLDTSASMMRKTEGTTLFEQAAREVAEVVRSAPPGTAFLMMTAGQAPVPVLPTPTLDQTEVIAAMDALKPAPGTMNVPEALQLALDLLAQGQNPGKQIIVYTDGQRHGWQLDDPGVWRLLGDRIDTLAIPPQIILRRMHAPLRLRNLAVEVLELSRPLVGTDRDVGINVTLLNTGSEAMTPGTITLVTGTNMFRKTVGQIPPGLTEHVMFTHRFTRAGAKTISAIIDVDDDIPGDNAFSKAFTTVDHAEVLIIDGNPAGRFIDSASAYAGLALAPSVDYFALPRQTAAPFLIRPSRIAAPEFSSRASKLDETDLVIMADVSQLPASAAGHLMTFVQEGGSLLVAPGRRALPEFYNTWQQDDGTPLMPAALGQRRKLRAEGQAMQLAPATFLHPVLTMIAEVLPEEIATLFIREAWTLQPLDSDDEHSVGARFRDGHPFFASHTVGDGQVAMTAIALDARDSNLPAMQSFVLLLHELLYAEAARKLPDLHQPAGREISLTVGTRERLDPSVAVAGETISTRVEAPDGSPIECSIDLGEDTATFHVRGGAIPGKYQIEIPKRLRAFLKGALNTEAKLPFTVQCDGREGQVAPLADPALKALPPSFDFSQADTAEAVAGIMQGAGTGSELWRSLTLAALALACAEVFLTRWISRGRRVPDRVQPLWTTGQQPS